MKLMPESPHHISLVCQLAQYITKHFLNSDHGPLLRDTAGLAYYDKCYQINGYTPDVEAFSFQGNIKVIIGEAKCSSDIENKHSKEQYTAFMQYCYNNAQALFIVAVPWHEARRTRTILSFLAKRNGIPVSCFTVPECFGD
jgi:hypothetical protein